MTLAPEDGPRSPLSPPCPPCRAPCPATPRPTSGRPPRPLHPLRPLLLLVACCCCCWMASGLSAAADVAEVVAPEASAGSGSSPRPPWIPDNFLANYTFNAIARASQCVRRVGPPPAHYCTAGADPTAPHPPCLSDLMDGGSPERVCRVPPGEERLRKLQRLRLGFCHRYRVERVLGATRMQQVARADAAECRTRLQRLLDMDETAQRVYCEFDQILTRYDCQQRFSIKWTCADCTTAYKAWVCSMMLPFHCGSCLIKPCRDGCHSVEQKCPYFLPDIKQQYAGEPTFLCIDHDIPETEAVTPSSSYGEPPNCYLPCHVGDAAPPCAENSNASSPTPSPAPAPPHATDTSGIPATSRPSSSPPPPPTVTSGGHHPFPSPVSAVDVSDACFPLQLRHDEPCGPWPDTPPTNSEEETSPSWLSMGGESASSSASSCAAPYPWRRSFSWQQRGQWWRCGPCLLVVALAAAALAAAGDRQVARWTFLPLPFCLGLT